jgi:hypothetical protein
VHETLCPICRRVWYFESEDEPTCPTCLAPVLQLWFEAEAPRAEGQASEQ